MNTSPILQSIVSKSAGKPVFIIGKGPSLDQVDCEALPDGLVINLNDSERVFAGDVGIFSANWVRHSLNETGFTCDYYLAGKPLGESVPHELLSPIPIELDQKDLSTLRLEKELFFDERFVLLNAIKLALLSHKNTNQPIDVYLLGFDFSTQQASQTYKAGLDKSGAGELERDAIISAQENEFKQLLHYFKAEDRLKLRHVGDKAYSALSIFNFNQELCGKKITSEVSAVDYTNPDRVLIVAELTNNHLGDPARLIEMVRLAKQSGADLIKVQKRDVNSFYTQEQLDSYYWSPFGETLGDYRRGVELSDEMLDLLDTTCREQGIEWFCSVLDYASYEALKRFSPKLIKVPSTISNHREYQQKLAADYTGALVVSTGLTSQEYVDHVLDTFKGNDALYLLHCISAYPAPLEDCNIAVVGKYAEMAGTDPRLIAGYSSHDLGSLGCMLAVASGARMLEKHVKLGNVDWVHFDTVAVDLETGEFARFVSDVRQAESVMGSGEKKVLECEHHKYAVR